MQLTKTCKAAHRSTTQSVLRGPALSAIIWELVRNANSEPISQRYGLGVEMVVDDLDIFLLEWLGQNQHHNKFGS